MGRMTRIGKRGELKDDTSFKQNQVKIWSKVLEVRGQPGHQLDLSGMTILAGHISAPPGSNIWGPHRPANLHN